MGTSDQKHISLEAFEQYLEARGLAAATRLAYLRVWKLLVGSLALPGVALKDVTPELARTLWATWTLGKGTSHHLQLKAGVKAIYRALGQPDPFADCEAGRMVEKKIRYLNGEQVSLVLGHLENNRKDYVAVLVYTLSVVLFHTGKRFGDISGILWSDVEFADGVPIVARLKTKGGKHEDCPLVSEGGRVLAAFKESQGSIQALRLLGAGGVRFARSPYVFCSANGLPISVQFYNEVLRRTGKELRLPFVLSSHVWRHSLATYLLNVQRANLREVQEILVIPVWRRPLDTPMLPRKPVGLSWRKYASKSSQAKCRLGGRPDLVRFGAGLGPQSSGPGTSVFGRVWARFG